MTYKEFNGLFFMWVNAQADPPRSKVDLFYAWEHFLGHIYRQNKLEIYQVDEWPNPFKDNND